jgi:hypothetical protein
VVVIGDAAAVTLGTPGRVAAREQVAAAFDGAVKAALPVFVDDRPGAAWVHRGETRVAFDFTVVDGRIGADRVPRRSGRAGRRADPRGPRARRPGRARLTRARPPAAVRPLMTDAGREM